jgi:tetratricopeptide (TPR) repeat protein
LSNVARFFRSLFSKPVAAGPDLSFGLLADAGIEALLQQKQWAQFEALVTELPTEGLTRLLDGLCLTTRYAALLQQYHTSGESEVRHFTAGTHDTFLAWEARSGALAKHVTEDQARGFEHYLTLAHEHLDRAFSTSRLQAQAYARLVRVLMGLGEPQEAQQAFYACAELVPDHLLGHINYFKLVAPRWFGNAEVLTEFVDGAFKPALRQLLQANFLVERYSDFEMEDAASAKGKLHQQYQGRIDQLRPQLKPMPGASLLAIYYNNYVACLHHILDEADERNRYLRELGNDITPNPWVYFGLGTLGAMQKLNPAKR